MKPGLYYLHSASFKLLIRQLTLLPVDILESVTGKRPHGIPPRRKLPCKRQEYVDRGKKLFSYFREYTDLQPAHAVLDTDPRNGELAVQLSRYLDKNGSYHGFDHDPERVDFCKRYITRLHPNFSFQFSNNFIRQGNASASKDHHLNPVPVTGNCYDLVFLSSAPAFMMPAEAELLLHEVSRVMKPGGSCMMQLYIVNCESENLMITRPTPLNFPVNKGLYRLQSKTGNSLVAFDEEWLLGKLENAGLKMKSIKYGSWCGRKHFLAFEDTLICSKV